METLSKPYSKPEKVLREERRDRNKIMKSFIRFLIAFFAVTGAVVVMTAFFGVQFNNYDYWDYHGFLLLIALTFFPRLAIILSSIPTGGLIWWLGWLFAPRLLVAVLATLNYWYQNPILVVISWLVALGGESSEKYVVVQKSRQRTERKRREEKWVDAEVQK